MSKQTIYIGVDVGKDELWAVVEGKRPRKFSHSATGIRALHRWVYRNNQSPNLHFCLEATGVYSQHLAVRLDQYKDATVSIVNPAQIAAYAKAQLRRTKTDQVDARVILSFAQTQQPPIWSPPPHELEQLYTLRSHADAIEAELQQWNNRIHAHSFRSKNLTKSVRTSCNKIQRVLKRELARIEQAMEELIATSDRLADNRDLLCSIPGIAEHSATKILAYGRDQFTRANFRQFRAWQNPNRQTGRPPITNSLIYANIGRNQIQPHSKGVLPETSQQRQAQESCPGRLYEKTAHDDSSNTHKQKNIQSEHKHLDVKDGIYSCFISCFRHAALAPGAFAACNHPCILVDSTAFDSLETALSKH
jgi:transposase